MLPADAPGDVGTNGGNLKVIGIVAVYEWLKDSGLELLQELFDLMFDLKKCCITNQIDATEDNDSIEKRWQ